MLFFHNFTCILIKILLNIIYKYLKKLQFYCRILPFYLSPIRTEFIFIPKNSNQQCTQIFYKNLKIRFYENLFLSYG